MAHPNARLKGPRWEAQLVKWFRGHGWDSERLRLAGKDDQGDVVVRDDGVHIVIEAKAAVRFDLAGWLKESLVERRNYAKARGLRMDQTEAMLIIKAPGRPITESYVVQSFGEVFGDPNEA
jgi:Holliday junction resolvase